MAATQLYIHQDIYLSEHQLLIAGECTITLQRSVKGTKIKWITKNKRRVHYELPLSLGETLQLIQNTPLIKE